MNINTIKTQLESFHYFTMLTSDTLLVGRNPVDIPGFPGGGTFEAFCSVEIRQHVIVVEHGKANLVEEEEFTTATKAVNFIKKTFPL